MEYADEKIIAFLNDEEQSRIPNDICTGPVRVGNRYYEFELRSFFDDKLMVYIPKDFEEMPERLKQLKYPSNQRPEIIQSDESGSTNIMLNRVDQDLKDEWVKELTDGMKAMLKRMNPAYVFYSEGMEQVEGKNFGYFEFKSPAIDDFLYNLMFFFEFEEKTVMGTFCCLYKNYADWREIAFQIFKNISVVKGDEQV